MRLSPDCGANVLSGRPACSPQAAGRNRPGQQSAWPGAGEELASPGIVTFAVFIN
ncbi:hypothetical protein [Raoultella terrigena]|uniref:hypothetical protein n=1 Tax=Raoultella terrigena TaxID=577 RepID=UPI001F1A34A9|nr:hypothetical protein [Raoultella terrigena]